MEGSSSLVCSADVAAFVDALETINCHESELTYNVISDNVICVTEEEEEEATTTKEEKPLVIVEEASDGTKFYNPDSRKQKQIMQQLVSSRKAVIMKKSIMNVKGRKQFKSDVWNWFGDVQLLISKSEADRLDIPFYTKVNFDNVPVMVSKIFVGCFKCSALFMYDAQKHSTSTLRYHIRACTRPKECIFVSDDKGDGAETKVPKENIEVNDALPKPRRVRCDPRKQKSVIEQLFQKQKAVVTKKSFMNMKGNRRFKSDVWNWFGDIKLLISRSEAKKLKIPYYIRRCGDEQMVLSKVFVGCFKCSALFVHDSQKSTSTLRYHIRTCSRPKESKKKRHTPNIIFFSNKNIIKPPEVFSDGDVIPAHEKLLNFALSTDSSLEVIKEAEFLKVLQMCVSIGALYGDVNIDSLLCPTPTLSSFILNDLYVTSVNSFYTEFQHSFGATYGINIWIDEQVKFPFISVICNYANNNGDMKSVIVHTDEFDYESKTHDHVKEWFSSFIADQPVVPFKRLILIDNESNLVPAFKDELCIKCVSQSMNNVLQVVISKGTQATGSELPDFTNLLSNSVDLVDYFEQISEQFPLPEELVRCQDDKWSSVLLLFNSINNQYENILAILNQTGDTHLLSIEKLTIASVVDFLKLFEDAFLQLSNCTEPTLNLVIPWIAELQKHCLVGTEDPPVLRQLKNHISLELDDRIIKNITVYHRIATLLDPRFKKLAFDPQEGHTAASIKLKCLVKECMESPHVEDFFDNRRVHGDTDRSIDFFAAGSSDSTKCEKAAHQEVDLYISEVFHLSNPEVQRLPKFNLFQYWNQNNTRYPNLSRLAQWILSCPASCVQTSDVFWSNNWLVNCCRLPLNPENVNKILFVKTFQRL